MKILALWWVCVSVLWVLPLKTPLNEQNSRAPKTHSISSEDESLGIGQSFNVTHNATRVIDDVALEWSNGSSTTYNVSLGNDWGGNAIKANITSLTDSRNWVNGTFDYGLSDGDNSTEDNDSGWHGLNWTFTKFDDSYAYQDPAHWNQWPFQEWPNPTNNISGNYNDSDSLLARNCLELNIQGARDPWNYGGIWADRYFYGAYEYGNWSINFTTPRGIMRDARLNFSANAWHVMGLDLAELRFTVDGIPFYSVGIYSLRQLCGGEQTWGDFSIPLTAWTNTTNVFSNNLDAITHNFTAQLIFTNNNSWWDGTNVEYQQIFISNIELSITSDLNPAQINLTMNDLSIASAPYGTGNIIQKNEWKGSKVVINFTSTNNASYNVRMQVSLELNASCYTPTTCYEANILSLGIKSIAKNNSDVIWDFYNYFTIPVGFVETNFTLYFPGDWVFTWVSTPQEPAVNQLSKCSVLVTGQLSIPVSLITATPDGFWKFRATSPNYLSNVVTYRNSTNAPGPLDWVPCQSIAAGDYLNISAQTFTNKNFTDFGATQALLDFKFPNGSLWFTRSQLVTPDSGGVIQFAPLQIPLTGVDYVAGDYKILIQWNNTLGMFSFNETSLFVTSVRIVHPARLQPDAESTVISDLLVGTTATIKISFLDSQSGEPIEGATITFTDLTGNTQTFTEYAPGYYIAEIYAPAGQEGSHSLTVQVTHPYFDQATVTIQVEVVGAGMPPWVYYLMGAAIVALLAVFLSYQRYFKYPKIIRGIRGLRGRIGKGKNTHVAVKNREASFTERYGGIVKQGGRLAAGIRSEFSVREFPEQAHPSQPTQPIQAPPQEVKSTPQPSVITPSQAPPATAKPPQQAATGNITPGTTTQHLKDQIVHMQQLTQILAETKTLQSKAAELEKRVKQVETPAAPNMNLIQLLSDLEKRLEKQKVQLEQEQAKNKQIKGIQQIAKIAAGIESRIQALQRELTQVQTVALPVTAASGGMESLVKDLQQKIAQIEPLLKDADAQVSKLEYSLKWRKKK